MNVAAATGIRFRELHLDLPDTVAMEEVFWKIQLRHPEVTKWCIDELIPAARQASHSPTLTEA